MQHIKEITNVDVVAQSGTSKATVLCLIMQPKKLFPCPELILVDLLVLLWSRAAPRCFTYGVEEYAKALYFLIFSFVHDGIIAFLG